MPLQNRVDPWGSLHAVPSRAATLMGNRGAGILHDEHQRVVRAQGGRAWIACALAFRGRQRTVMGPGSYTELFLLDEATALAAGHRPCFECRRARAEEFLTRWRRTSGRSDARVGDLDAVLAAQRRVSRAPLNRGKRAHRGMLDEQPAGAIVEVAGDAWLIGETGVLRWGFDGYDRVEMPPAPDADCWVLTPRASVAVLRAGYRPELHPSARPDVRR